MSAFDLADERRVASILGADEGDPFSFLGMHAMGDRLVVRAFQPCASGVSVVRATDGKSVAGLIRVHPAGFFAGTARGRKPFGYRLLLAQENAQTVVADPYSFGTVFGDLDFHLHAEGQHLRTFEKLGAHPVVLDGTAGTHFAVWAPNARRVSVVGDFNAWDGRRHPMRFHPAVGIWELFLPGVEAGALYKFEIKTRDGAILLKADPYAFQAEQRPATASIVCRKTFMRASNERLDRAPPTADHRAPVSIYEVHLGSWRRVAAEGDRWLTYRELADELVPYVRDLGFTHLELLPVAEHPFDGSWGYQPTGLFAVTSRYGTPDDFAAFVRRCHEEGLGVIVDWAGGHFPNDPHGLAQFDGTHLYEHRDPREGLHPDWKTLIYNYGRREVRNYLLSNALFWLSEYGIDGLRVDAVASMLYRNYSRKAGEWIANAHGGVENLEAIEFLRALNELVYREHPKAVTIAEESTAWPMVSRPTYAGGLGFGYKWNMGWMNDTLQYMAKDPVHRKYHQDKLTFGLLYAFDENFVLPLSHDEVTHGKGSLLGKMPGDRWQQFANLRAYYGFMYTYPGKKLLFMGGEFGQQQEWNHTRSLDWDLLADPLHRGIQDLVRDLNRLYRTVPALHRGDCESQGFAWIDCSDCDNSVIACLRRDPEGDGFVVVVSNFTPVVRHGYRIGVPRPGTYAERLNTDSRHYGGSNVGNLGAVAADAIPQHGHGWSLSLTLPPLATLVLEPKTCP